MCSLFARISLILCSRCVFWEKIDEVLDSAPTWLGFCFWNKVFSPIFNWQMCICSLLKRQTSSYLTRHSITFAKFPQYTGSEGHWVESVTVCMDVHFCHGYRLNLIWDFLFKTCCPVKICTFQNLMLCSFNIQPQNKSIFVQGSTHKEQQYYSKWNNQPNPLKTFSALQVTTGILKTRIYQTVHVWVLVIAKKELVSSKAGFRHVKLTAKRCMCYRRTPSSCWAGYVRTTYGIWWRKLWMHL